MCLWVMIVYLLIGTIMFAEWEGWNYLDSVYFCFTSLAKIGFGDFVPGTSTHTSLDFGNKESSSVSKLSMVADIAQIKLVITFIYILLGMAIVAMCYHLLKEEVLLYLKKLKDKTKKRIQLLQDTMYITASHK